MTRAPIQSRRRQPKGTPPPTGPRPIGLPRLAIFLPIMALVIALVAQIGFKAAGLESTHPLRVFGTPLIAGAVLYVGLRPYPKRGRIRAAAMVALGLFLFAMLT